MRIFVAIAVLLLVVAGISWYIWGEIKSDRDGRNDD